MDKLVGGGFFGVRFSQPVWMNVNTTQYLVGQVCVNLAKLSKN